MQKINFSELNKLGLKRSAINRVSIFDGDQFAELRALRVNEALLVNLPELDIKAQKAIKDGSGLYNFGKKRGWRLAKRGLLDGRIAIVRFS